MIPLSLFYQTQYCIKTSKKRNMILHPQFWLYWPARLKLYVSPQWIFWVLLLYLTKISNPERVPLILLKLVANLAPQVTSLHENSSIENQPVVDVLSTFPEGHAFWMRLLGICRRITNLFHPWPAWNFIFYTLVSLAETEAKVPSCVYEVMQLHHSQKSEKRFLVAATNHVQSVATNGEAWYSLLFWYILLLESCTNFHDPWLLLVL